MEFFKRAKVFRLKCGHHNKYLVADKDDETIRQSANSSSTNAHWAIELVEGKSNVVRFRSCHTWKYIATTDETFLTGMTGKKIAQRLRLDSTVEWELIKEGPYIKLKSHAAGTFLRANPWIPPWRNSVTHDEPGHWTGTENMVLWIVDIVEIDYNSNRGSKDGNQSNRVDSPTRFPDVVNNNVPHSPSSSSSNGASPKNSDRPKESSAESRFKPAQGGLESEFKRPERTDSSGSDRGSRRPSVETMTGLAVNVAKITFKELKNMEFHAVLSSGDIMKLEKAVSVMAADAKISGKGRVPANLANLDQKVKLMKKNHSRATKELVECTSFSSERYEIRAELKKDAALARELQVIQAELNTVLTSAKALRDELLKQLEETESSIEDAEKGQADNSAEIEELLLRIQRKSEAFKVMEREHRSWKVRKYEAERTLERIEEDWMQVKDIVSNFW